MSLVRAFVQSVVLVWSFAAIAACHEAESASVTGGGDPERADAEGPAQSRQEAGTAGAPATGGTASLDLRGDGGAALEPTGAGGAPPTEDRGAVPSPDPAPVVSAAGGARSSGGATGVQVERPETLGTGSMVAPAVGPAPQEAAQVGSGWVLVKNWNFGTAGTVRDIATLSSEWMYHDQFGTIGNGPNYGALTVAPDRATAIDGQPIESPARRYREFTPEALRTYVRPLSPTQATVSARAHDAGNGSITAKWKLPRAGSGLGKDILWESRVRMPETEPGYWFAIWTSGNRWDDGAEMDVLESFGTPNIYPPPSAFHVNSVGGHDHVDYTDWPRGLTAAGVPVNARDLRQWHTFTWVYRKDDTYTVYFDGHVVQKGTLTWTVGGARAGARIDMSFLYDFGWGHTQVSQVNLTLPAAGFRIVYEVDHSRVYLR